MSVKCKIKIRKNTKIQANINSQIIKSVETDFEQDINLFLVAKRQQISYRVCNICRYMTKPADTQD